MIQKSFEIVSRKVSAGLGTVWTAIAILFVVSTTAFYNGFSENWQRVVSVSVAITSLLCLVFLQRSQAHGDQATHAKLDELIRAVDGARNEMAAVESVDEDEIEMLRAEGNHEVFRSSN